MGEDSPYNPRNTIGSVVPSVKVPFRSDERKPTHLKVPFQTTTHWGVERREDDHRHRKTSSFTSVDALSNGSLSKIGNRIHGLVDTFSRTLHKRTMTTPEQSREKLGPKLLLAPRLGAAHRRFSSKGSVAKCNFLSTVIPSHTMCNMITEKSKANIAAEKIGKEAHSSTVNLKERKVMLQEIVMANEKRLRNSCQPSLVAKDTETSPEKVSADQVGEVLNLQPQPVFDLSLAVNSKPDGNWKVSINKRPRKSEKSKPTPEAERSLEVLKSLCIDGRNRNLQQNKITSHKYPKNPFFNSVANSQNAIPDIDSEKTNPRFNEMAISGTKERVQVPPTESSKTQNLLFHIDAGNSESSVCGQSPRPIPSIMSKDGLASQSKTISNHANEVTTPEPRTRTQVNKFFSNLQVPLSLTKIIQDRAGALSPSSPNKRVASTHRSVKELAAEFIKSLSSYKLPRPIPSYPEIPRISLVPQIDSHPSAPLLRLNLEQVRTDSPSRASPGDIPPPSSTERTSPIPAFTGGTQMQLDSYRSRQTQNPLSSPRAFPRQTHGQHTQDTSKPFEHSTPGLLTPGRLHSPGDVGNRGRVFLYQPNESLLQQSSKAVSADRSPHLSAQYTGLLRHKEYVGQTTLEKEAEHEMSRQLGRRVQELTDLLHAERTKARQLHSALVNTIESEQDLKHRVKSLMVRFEERSQISNFSSQKRIDHPGEIVGDFKAISVSLEAVRGWLEMIVEPVTHLTEHLPPKQQEQRYGKPHQSLQAGSGRNKADTEDLINMLDQAQALIHCRRIDWGDLNGLMSKITTVLRNYLLKCSD